MRGQCWKYLLFALAIAKLAWSVSPVQAQGRASLPAESSIITWPAFPEPRDAVQDADTYVSFIDSALPRSQVRARVDWGTRMRRPTRAEFFQAKGGLPSSPGPPLPETSLDYLDVPTYAEIAIVPRFSTFFNTPFRWIDPDVNRSEIGLGDMDLGLKWALLSTSDFLLTFQLRMYVPTATSRGLGTHHVSLEPALLFNYQFLDFLTLEGEGRFWAPIGGTDFAGEVFRYGVGISYGQRSPTHIWLVPVLEAVGWTVVGGKALVTGPGGFFFENAGGNTIFDLNGGFRLGLGDRASIYTGYGRALTGRTWYKDIWRLEFRFFF